MQHSVGLKHAPIEPGTIHIGGGMQPVSGGNRLEDGVDEACCALSFRRSRARTQGQPHLRG